MSGIFIQIGAGAGDMDIKSNYRDGFTEFVKNLPRYKIKKIILVEPNPANIPMLRECWKDYPESVIYQIGIVPSYYHKNTIDFYYCPDDAPHYQVASIKKTHVQKHYGLDCALEKFVISTKKIEDFLTEVTTEEIELLALDIEGVDADVILELNFKNIKVKSLSFEFLHLGDQHLSVINYLKDNNFEYAGNGVDHNGYDHLYVQIKK
jgi:FkbM family methyltransferase